MAKTSVIAHRGVNREAPENTIPAFKKAVEYSFDIELDPQRSKDGDWVVMHDLTVDRTTDGHGVVTDLTLKQLQKLDAGCKFNRDLRGIRIPTLEEVFDLVRGKVKLYLNFRGHDLENENYQKEIVKLLEKYEGMDQAFVTLVTPETGKSFKRLNPNIKTVADDNFSPLFCGKPYEYLLTNRDSREFKKAVGYVFGHLQEFPYVDVHWINEVDLTGRVALFLTPELVERVHSLGRTIVFGHLYFLERWKDLVDMGVDGILTNQPHLLKRLIDNPAFPEFPGEIFTSDRGSGL